MAPMALDEIKLEDIDFDVVKQCTDKRIVKRYIKLIEEDGNYFTDLLKACKEKLLLIAPKDYYLLYPIAASENEITDATADLLEWEASVKEIDKSLKNVKKDRLYDNVVGYKVSAPIRGQEVERTARPNVQKEPGRPKLEDGPRAEDDRFARDKTNMKDYYKSWDKVDVDEMEEEFDEKEKKEEEARRVHFEDLKEQQDETNTFAPIKVEGTEAVPEAHRRYMADTEKEKGNEAFYAKDWEEAEAYYSRSLRYKADDPSTWANRALVRIKLNNAQGALQDCDHALAVNPNYMKALHRKGKALHELGRYEDAVKSFQLALAESPGNTQINGDLMVARRKLRTDPTPASRPMAKGPASTTSAPRIEELESTTHMPKAKAPAPAANYTRVAIEEDSDSEEEDAGGGGSVSSTSGQGFRKIAIEEVSCSEDEEEVPVKTSAVSRASAAPPSAPRTASSPSTASKPSSAGFKKVVIEEDSDSGEDAAPAARSTTGGSSFTPPPRVAVAPPKEEPPNLAVEASPEAGFDEMD